MPAEQDKPPRPTLRAPTNAQVKVHFESQTGFVAAYAANISLTGIFIRTQQPRLPGTRLHFELKLPERRSLMRGVGEVVWSRPGAESEERPAGIGVRFLQIDQDSRELISRVVRRHFQRGDDPLALGDG